MAKYIVSVGTAIRDRDGNTEGEEFRYTFDELPLIESRNKAIEKVKSIQSFFFDEMPESNKFISFGEGLLSESLEYNSVLIELIFSPEDNMEYVIYGECDYYLMPEHLTYEAEYYNDNEDNQPLIDLPIGCGGWGEGLLESDIDFFLELIEL